MAIRAQGTTFKISTGVLDQVVGQVTGFSGLGGGSTTEIDISHLGSAAKEFLPGLRDNGTITVNLNTELTDQGQRLLWQKLNAGTVEEFQISVPNAAVPASPTILTLNGAILTFEIGASVDDAYRSTVSIRVSGAVTGFPAPS